MGGLASELALGRSRRRPHFKGFAEAQLAWIERQTR
jgi:hypothetical protein